jgi:protein subunit release factor A
MSKDALAERMERLGIRDFDEETFARSGGRGPKVKQGCNRCDAASQAGGIRVTVQDSRSQAVNRKLAQERLLDAIEAIGKNSVSENRKARKSAAKKIPTTGCTQRNSRIETETWN